ncbi:sugar transferase [Haloarchaeobius litoreus]|uniref:Sugar transferase n=1 Tax=Haloarchaeobius litoreus TaxID=755306 RepID=A0ABD6DII8_9EURY|nr:sugar transferase [Haloarchaeobius litoreus]
MEHGRALYLLWLVGAVCLGLVATGVALAIRGAPLGPPVALFCSVSVLAATVVLAPLAKTVGRRTVAVVGLGVRGTAVAALVLFTGWTLATPSLATLPAVAGAVSVFALLVPALGLGYQSLVARRREGAVVVGSDLDDIATAAERLDGSVTGFVRLADGVSTEPVHLTDGAIELRRETLESLPTELASSGTRFGATLDSATPERVVLAFSDVTRDGAFSVLDACHARNLPVATTEPASDRLLTGSRTDDGFVEVHTSPLTPWQELEKRAFDIAFAVAGLVFVTPFVPLIALAVRLDSPGPILYRQVRTERFGNRFVLPKFRTMVENAESETGAVIMDDNEDSRITRVGAVLRTTYLDEIPQLVSVLVGRMSAVGPRPERPELDAEWTDDVPAWPRRWHVKPGLTGFAQVDFEGFDEGQYAADNLRADDRYMSEWSLWLDCKLVAMQFGKLFEKLNGD